MAEKPSTSPEPPVSASDLARALDALIAARTSGVAQETAEAVLKIDRHDDRDFPKVSVFNPQGDKDHPRPPLRQEVFWAGIRILEPELTTEEIDLLNQLEPGNYGPNGQWTVRDMEPGSSPRRLMVKLPSSHEGRMALMKYDRGRGMVDLLQEVFLAPA